MKITARTLTVVMALSSSMGAGCMADASDVASNQSGLLAVNAVDASELPEVPRSQWAAAPEGCDGRVLASDHLARAEGERALVVAVRGERVVCVDSLASLDRTFGPAFVSQLFAGSELADDEQPTRIRTTWQRQPVGAVSAEPSPQPSDPGDTTPTAPAVQPSPQPSRPPDSTPDPVGGAPSPQPSEPISGQPSPQPSEPTSGQPSPQPSDNL